MDLLITTILKRPQPFTDADDAGNLIAANFYRDQEEYLLALAQSTMSAPWNVWNDVLFLDENEAANLPVPNFYREQEELGNTVLLASQAITWLDQQLGDDEVLARSPNTIVEDEAFQGSTQAIYWVDLPFTDDEVCPHLTALEEIQEPPPIYRQLVQLNQLLAVTFLTDEEWSAGMVDQEDNYLVPIPIAGPTSYKALWVASPFQDDSDNVPTLRLEEELQWQPLVQLVQWTPTVVLDEHGTSPLAGFGTDQEDWAPPATQAISWSGFAWLDEAGQGSMRVSGLDQEEYNYGGLPQLLLCAFTGFLPADDPSSVQLGNFAVEDDRGLLGSLTDSQRVQWTAVPALDDEVSATLVSYWSDQQEPYSVATELLPWVCRVWQDDETLAAATYFASEQQEPYYPAAQAVPWIWCSPDSDEVGGSLLSFGLEDDRGYDGAVQQLPWVSRAATDDEIYARFGLEDEQPYAAAVQQISWSAVSFTSDELACYIVYDDYPLYKTDCQQVLWNCVILLDDEIMVVTPAVVASRRLRLIGWDATIVALTGDGQ